MVFFKKGLAPRAKLEPPFRTYSMPPIRRLRRLAKGPRFGQRRAVCRWEIAHDLSAPRRTVHSRVQACGLCRPLNKDARHGARLRKLLRSPPEIGRFSYLVGILS